ncbi:MULTISPECIES: hypothetical protein [Micromonospora]|nr:MULTISPECIES: hypothetical protein [unclassified Micromonospora]
MAPRPVTGRGAAVSRFGLVRLFDSAAEIDKAHGVRINLWAGR